ncbi:MAG: UDP-N-acetylmuramate--L-alanine ligase, partial [Chlamydiae bacterium]|nr:UDP-N-acetylmuramate--L-alanine ligase [Chlamydiota bacterium]
MSETYHFIGLGGIGMSALARILIQQGIKVQGSDRKESVMLEMLKKEGAIVSIGHAASQVGNAATVVYSSDIKEENEELLWAKEKKLTIFHRSELLDRLTQDKKVLFVTGTHGKTTTTSLLAWVQMVAKLDPTIVVGGIMENLQTNGRAGKGAFFVAEADESDGSFLKTVPFGAIVTNIDNDHMNFWQTDEKLDMAFQTFLASVKSKDHLFWCKDYERINRLNPPGFSYGFSENADLQITSFENYDNGIFFDLKFQGKTYPKIDLSLFGKHNAQNGAAVFGLSLQLGIKEEMIREAFKSFKGAKRRLEFKGEAHKLKIFDDYAHHPRKIAATLAALRQKVHERRIVAIFEPHRFTRVKDLIDEFPLCFQDADLVVLTDIYSAGEAPIEAVTTASLFTKMKEVLGAKLHFFPREHLESGVLELLKPLDVAIMLGAGNITAAGDPILKGWQEKAPKIRVALLFGGESQEHEVSIMSAKTFAIALDR